jgi:hyperosmotically inducible protein
VSDRTQGNNEPVNGKNEAKSESVRKQKHDTCGLRNRASRIHIRLGTTIVRAGSEHSLHRARQLRQQQEPQDHRRSANRRCPDRNLTAQIRKSIMADKTLSMYAHNIKIITINGMVTLKGPVKSDAEKQTVADLAAQATGGADKVTNKITVKQ